MSLVGKEIDVFSAQAYQNGKFLTVSSEDFKGKWSVVCFYPADFTFVCPTELEDLQEQYNTLKGLGVEVYSVSTDTPLTRTPSFMINRVDAPPSGVVFASVPLGHEFSSFILALLQVIAPILHTSKLL